MSRRASALRMATLFAAVAALVVVAAVGSVRSLVERVVEREAARGVEADLDRMTQETDRIGGEVVGALALLREDLRLRDPGLRERLARGGPGAVEVAAGLGRRAGLDLLAILDDRGTVISASHWPQLAGLAAPSLDGLAEGSAVLRRVPWPSRKRLALVARLAVDLDGVALQLIGGRAIDGRFAAALAPARPTLLVDLDAEGEGSFATRGDALGPVEEWEAWVASGASGPPPVGPAGTRWLARTRRLVDDGGRGQAAVVVATAVEPGLTGGPLRILLGAAMLVVALAAAGGAWAASRLARPVDRLVRAVDAIAAGEADYTFPGRAEHELDRLAGAFSRLQRSLERQQRRSAAAERVAAWREVARRVAHEVKNPLAPIRLTVENLQRARRNGGGSFDELFDEGALTILEEVEQLRRLVQEFSEFARLPAPEPRAVELHALVEDVLDLYAAEPGLVIVRELEARPSRVEADPDQLGRALKNVVGNAVEAMRDTDGPSRLKVRTRREGGMVEIRVADNGPGIPGRAAGQLFEPYVTTKPHGTGLGMAITQRIVTEHGGEVTAENRSGGGACIRIRLPAAGAESDR